MLREEELRWYQRSKSNFILKGDANTKYFHNVTNGRHRKKSIHALNQDEGMIESQEQLKAFITSYYKDCSALQLKISWPWMRLVRKTYPRSLMRRITF